MGSASLRTLHGCMAGADRAGSWGCEGGLWAGVMIPSLWHLGTGLASEEGSYEGPDQAPHPVSPPPAVSPLSLVCPAWMTGTFPGGNWGHRAWCQQWGTTSIVRPQPHWGARADCPQPETPADPPPRAGTPRILLSLTVHFSPGPLPTRSSPAVPGGHRAPMGLPRPDRAPSEALEGPSQLGFVHLWWKPHN